MIINFPGTGNPCLPAGQTASKFRIAKDRVCGGIYRLCNFIGLPAFIKPFIYTDQLTDVTVQIAIFGRFTRLTVNERDYYFDRLTGKFDGTGSSFMSTEGNSGAS